jgi:hypothetical protein
VAGSLGDDVVAILNGRPTMALRKYLLVLVSSIALFISAVGASPASASTTEGVSPPAAALLPDVVLPDGSVYSVPTQAAVQLERARQQLSASDPALFAEVERTYQQTVRALQADTASTAAVVLAPKRACVTVTKSAVIAFAWVVIGYGSLLAAVGGFLDLTIVGLPAGAVLNAIGIGDVFVGTVLLDRANRIKWSSKRVCI